MTDHTASQKAIDLVGGRPRADVERAYGALEAAAAAPQTQTQFSRGALSGYVWALGHATAAPVTGADSHGAPDMLLLTAEVDAALVQLSDQSLRTVPRDYVHGVHDALAWVCGYSDEQPAGGTAAVTP
jgi:hypothetical protein